MTNTIYKKKKDWQLFLEIYSSNCIVILKNKETGIIKKEKDDWEQTPFLEYINNKYEKINPSNSLEYI